MPARTKTHDPYAALRYPDYRFYALGHLVFFMGRQMLSMAVGWEIYQKTHSMLALGMIGFIQWLPIFLLTLPAGLAVDRYNRKGVVIFSQWIFTLCSLGLATVSYYSLNIFWMYVLLFFIGVSRTFSDPARQALLPQLLPARDFPNAITWGSTIFQAAAIGGPLLGGWLIAAIGLPAVYLIDALCGMTLFACMVFIRKAPPSSNRRETLTLHSLLAGIKFVWHTKIILATITMDLFAVILGGATALLPAFTMDILHSDSVGLGWLQAATPIGALATSVLLAHLPPMKKAGQTLLGAVAGFGAATVVFGLSKWFWLSLGMMLLVGAFDNISVIVRGTLVQLLTPDRMRGRVTSISYIFIHSSNDLGGFESGLTAALLGAVPSVVLGGIGSILVVLAVIAWWPQVAKLGSLQDPLKGSSKDK